MEEIFVSAKGREKRWLLRTNGETTGLYTYQPQDDSLTGNIYWGKVVKVQSGLGAAFVDIGHIKNGFLHEKDFPQNVEAYHSGSISIPIGKCVHEGQKIMVQVVKDAIGTKGPRLSAVIEFRGEHLVYMPLGHYVAVSKKIDEDIRKVLRGLGHEWKESKEGLVIRTNAASVNRDVLFEELNALRNLYEGLQRLSNRLKPPALLSEEQTFYEELLDHLKKGEGGRVYVDHQSTLQHLEEMVGKLTKDHWNFHLYQGNENIFHHYEVSAVWENVMKKVVWLDKGAFLVIESTEAMTVVDVNSGKFTGKNDVEQTILQTNILAAKEMAKQLTLRNLSGIIMIDFIDMKKEAHRIEVINALSDALVEDRQRTSILGFTALGILELTRKRTRLPLTTYLTQPCTTCNGSGRVVSAESKAFQLERDLWELEGVDASQVVIDGTKDVLQIFAGEQSQHLKKLEKILHKQITLHEENHPHPYYKIRKIE
ncbi:Rne/Rng family ribonuclease [Rossellomorea aquimaris]|uniref:Rne/Rng family ribonuclease n=1 Tax=Rossellomorea aquimaris TaxID=189382 RepID=UPI0018D36890|nr:Rne/Rng family ribonuclease [Rossellomorea aquimaris]